MSLKDSSSAYLNYLHSVTPVKMAVRMEVGVGNNTGASAGKVLKLCVCVCVC